MKATVVIAPISPEGDALRDLIARWALAELLDPSWWLVPADVTGPLDGTLQGLVIDGSGSRVVPLLDSLANDRLEQVRLVVVQLLPDASAADPELARFARLVDALFDMAIPNSVTRTRLNLLIPATGVTDIDPEILLSGWETNALVSPEDRASGDRVNVLVRHPENFIGHAAVELVSVSGMWSGMDDGPFDDNHPESSDGAPDPVVVRSFVRIVRGGRIVDQVADRVLDRPSDHWPVPSGSEPAPIMSPNASALVARATHEAMEAEDGMFGFRAAAQEPLPLQRRVGIWQTLSMMLSFLWRLLRRLPSYAIERAEARIRTSTEERMTKLAFGQESAFVVRAGATGDALDPPQDPATLSLEEAVTRASSLLDDEGREMFVAATPSAWHAIRQFSISSIDSGPIPIGFTTPEVGGRRELLTDPSFVVPSAAEPRFVVPDDVCMLSRHLEPFRGHELSPCDPFDATRMLTALSLAQRQLRALELPERERASVNQANADASRDRARTEADGEQAAELQRLADRLDHEAAEAMARAVAWAEKAARVEYVLDDLTAIVGVRSKAFLWKVGQHIADGIGAAIAVLRASLPAARAGVEVDWQVPNRAQHELLRGWLILLGVLGVVIGGSFVANPWTTAARLAGGAAVVALVIMFMLFLKYHRLVHQFERQVELAVCRFRQAESDAYQAAGEITRLGVIYQQYVEWGEITGWVTHRPWSVSELPDPPAQPGLPTDDLVQAIAIGRAELSDALLLSLSRRVSRETITQGWLGDLYDCEVGRSMSRLQLAMGRGGGVINPDSDTPHAPNGGRAQLIDELRSEVIQREARADAHRRVAEFCAEVDPQEVFDQVIPLHNGTAASAQPIMEFLADLLPTDAHPEPFATSSWTSKAQTKELHYVDQTTCWSPPALQRTAVGAHRVIVKTTESTTTASGSYVVKTIRVDQSKVTSLEDFAIFAARTLELAVPAVSEGKMY